jgi:protein phosphatase
MTLSGLFDTGAATHAGKVRAQNEDNMLVRPDIGLWAVADGMGGHEAGGLASAMVVEALRKLRPVESGAALLRACEESLTEANASIRAIAEARGFEAIGTTVVVLLIAGDHFACLWAGDSRIYLVRDGAIMQITRDHSEVQELIDQGTLSEAEAKTWPRRNVITRAIGVFEAPECEKRHGEVEPGDMFILCSDGLTAHVEDDEIAARATTGAAQTVCADLVQLTLDRGAKDNVTVVGVRSRSDGTVVPPSGQMARGSQS